MMFGASGHLPYTSNNNNTDYLNTQVYLHGDTGNTTTTLADNQNFNHYGSLDTNQYDHQLGSGQYAADIQHDNSSSARYGSYNTATHVVHELPMKGRLPDGHGVTTYQPSFRKQSFTSASLFDMIAKSQLNLRSSPSRKPSKTVGITTITKSISKNRLGMRDVSI